MVALASFFSLGGFGLTHFVSHNAVAIKRGGYPVLIRKALTLLEMALAVPPVLLVRMIRPLVLIRFGAIRSNRIGAFPEDLEPYLNERELGMQNPKAVDIFHYKTPISNYQYKRMADRAVRTSRFARPFGRVNLAIPGGSKHVVTRSSTRFAECAENMYQLLPNARVYLSFTPEEERKGREHLQELGIPPGAAFVCFQARDSAYFDALISRDWSSKHDYRNNAINNYLSAAEELANRGYFAIRMGSIVKEALATSNPRVLDYSTTGRTDFLDIYLSAKCDFFLTCASGLEAIAFYFRRPIALVNHVPFAAARGWGPNDLWIPKKHWLREERRFMTFPEILDSGASRFGATEQYNRMGIEVVENTPEEIADLAVEMDERLKGTWKTTEEDEQLQRRIRSLFKFSDRRAACLPRMGSRFLRENRDLLDPRSIKPGRSPGPTKQPVIEQPS